MPEDDPLSSAVARSMMRDEAEHYQLDSIFEPWEFSFKSLILPSLETTIWTLLSMRKPGILSRYTTNEKLSIVSSFLGPGANDSESASESVCNSL